MTYWTNGMVNQVARPNSTTDTYAKDPNDIARPASVKVQGLLGLTLWNTGTYTYDGSGNIWKMTNGSNIDTFTYDKVSRLREGKIISVAKKQCQSYDAFGNIKGQATVASSQTCTPSAWSVDSGTNRFLLPVTYDAAGNQTLWNSGLYSYGWYPTGQMRQFDGSNRTTIHGYTADGERVGTYDSYAPAGIAYTLRGLDGKVLRVYRESGGVWTWVQDYVYRDRLLLATIDSTGTRYLHLDHLGTARLITNSSGSQVALHTYLPFGQEATSTSQDSERMKFTGHERDLRDPSNTTDDLDSMHARYSNPNLGRFLSPDPGRDWNPAKPQSWKMYTYAMNNPLRLVDPTGMAIDEFTTGTTANQSSGLVGPPAGSRQAEKAQTPPPAQPSPTSTAQAPTLPARDQAYLDKYYEPVAAACPAYGVSPELVLGVGIESGFASAGTYLRTGDAFGMTGGGTKNMTTASSPTENVQQWFRAWGPQVQGAGSDAARFVNGLQGQDAAGNRVSGWRVYNSAHPAEWREMVQSGIDQMRREVPLYLQRRGQP